MDNSQFSKFNQCSQFKKLKLEGNECFINGQWMRALNFYSKAIKLGKVINVDNLELAALYSISAKLYFEMGRFEDMLEAINESLHYDPTCKDSLFLHVIVKRALKQNEGVEQDLRFLLTKEPNNIDFLEVMRQVRSPAKIHDSLLKAHLANYLRRATINAKVSNYLDMTTFAQEFNYFLLRMAFLSRRNSIAMKPFLESTRFEKSLTHLSSLYLPQFFAIKFAKCRRFKTCFTEVFGYSDYSLSIMFKVVEPVDIQLVFISDVRPVVKSKFYNFSEVTYNGERNGELNFLAPINHLCAIAMNSHILTRLPCFDGVTKLKDLSFPKINSIIVPREHSVDAQFLKIWHERKWAVKSLFFHLSKPELSAFEKFSGVVSKCLTDVSLPISENMGPLKFIPNAAIKRFKANLITLKQVFPKLSTVTGTINLHLLSPEFDDLFLDTQFKEDLKYLVEKFNSSVRPKCYEKIQVYVIVGVACIGDYRPSQKSMEKMERLFKEFQAENKVKGMKSFLRKPPFVSKLDKFRHFASFTLVELETKDARIEYSLQALGYKKSI